LVDDGDIIGK